MLLPFSSNIWTHIRILGLQNQYQDNKNFTMWLRMLSALAFVPPNNVIRYFELLIDEFRNNFNNESDDLIDYFENTYIGICFIKFIKWYSGPLYKGNQGTMSPPPSLLPPLLFKAKFIFLKIILLFLYLLSKSIRNVFLRLQEELKCKLFLRRQPWWRLPYALTSKIKFWPLLF